MRDHDLKIHARKVVDPKLGGIAPAFPGARSATRCISGTPDLLRNLLPLFLLLSTCTHCGRNDSAPSVPPSVAVTIDTQAEPLVIQAELALTPKDRERGLMFRQELADGQGMLFVFMTETDHHFWMKNTLIPLDMLFLDREKRIVGIVHEAEPRSEKGVGVGVPSQYVLEVPGGYCHRYGVKPGMQTRFNLR